MASNRKQAQTRSLKAMQKNADNGTVLEFSTRAVLAPVTTILAPYGGAWMRTRVGMLTLHEWYQAVSLFPEPKVEINDLNADGEPVANPKHPDHVKKQQRVAGLRTTWRVLCALEKGGEDLDDDPNMPPAHELEARIDYVRKHWDGSFLNGIANFLSVNIQNRVAEVEEIAESFRQLDDDASDDEVAAETDSGGVAQDAAGPAEPLAGMDALSREDR